MVRKGEGWRREGTCMYVQRGEGWYEKGRGGVEKGGWYGKSKGGKERGGIV